MQIFETGNKNLAYKVLYNMIWVGGGCCPCLQFV